MSLRRLALLNAATLVAEMGGLQRFQTAGQLMGYLELVPSEAATSDDRKQGGITKMGNGIVAGADQSGVALPPTGMGEPGPAGVSAKKFLEFTVRASSPTARDWLSHTQPSEEEL